MMEIDEQQAAIRSLIRFMMERTGQDATGLAKSAGVAPSTLTRFLNQPVKHLLSARTLAKLSKASGVEVPAGGPVLTPFEREVLTTLRSTDDQGRAMIERFVRSLRHNDPPTAASAPPKERAAPAEEPAVAATSAPTRRASGCVVRVGRIRGTA